MAIERALLSVSDKTGLVPLARSLRAKGVELLSTGGTAKHLADNGIEVIPVSRYTGAPEILGGRVKTLHPKVFGGVLFNRSESSHRDDCATNGIGPIDLVVVNLYPFESTVAQDGVTIEEAIEQIDVGGPSMLRAAAKNHKDVVVLPDPSLYGRFLEELEKGEISAAFRRDAAIRTFARTAEYDSAIASYLSAGSGLFLRLEKIQDLRYGENPQQTAGFYAAQRPFEQLHGKELSYNNLLDLDAAFRLATSFDRPAATIIKHTNPCGTAVDANLVTSIHRAIEADPISAFGGILGVNRQMDGAAAEAIGELFLEVIIAPSFTPEAIERLSRRKNLRLVKTDRFDQPMELRSAAGGVLVQSFDRFNDPANWKVVTKLSIGDGLRSDLEFAWTLCGFVKSNAIVIASEGQSIGIGAGQMSRVDAAKLAITKSTRSTQGAVAASDAFFPFRDGLDVLAAAGVRAIIQPGGSVRDEEVIEAADERGIAMIFTGERHFRH
jgi:phosphoribosylaminoimidazolecarboxamide formyltransferase / IMP cyclohydrolase